MPESYDPYELLDVEPGASADELRRAFRRKAKRVHPDVSDAADAAEQFARLKASFDLLLERLDEPGEATAEDLYRPSQPLDEEQQELIIQAHRRRQEAHQRFRSGRRAAMSRGRRRAERQTAEFREELERRRAAMESEGRSRSDGGG